jgi:ABC-type lipoprotein release transport system permease subunit
MMSITWLSLRLRAEARTRWRTWLGLGLIVGLLGGAVLTAAAGARRTDTAYSRLERSTNAADVLISTEGTGLNGYDAALGRLPQVAEVAKIATPALALIGPKGAPDTNVYALLSVDGRFGISISRPKVVAGRLPLPTDAANAALVDLNLARRFHLHPGSRLATFLAPVDAQGSPELGKATRFVLAVTGIGVFDDQIVPSQPSSSHPGLLLGPAFFRAYGARFDQGDGAFLRIRPVHGASGRRAEVASLRKEARDLTKKYPATQGQAFFGDLAQQRAAVERAIRPEALALYLFAALLGLLGLVMVGQLLGRQVDLDASDHPVLRALGADRRQLFALSMLRAGVMAVVGACLAVVVAVAASPLMPIGPARLAEPSPGIEANLAVLFVGMGCVVALALLAAAPAAWRAAGGGTKVRGAIEPTGAGAPLRAVRSLAAVRLPLSAIIGARMALEPGRGAKAVPVRSALLGTTVALAATMAALTFGTSLGRLVDTPERYGQTWNLEFDASIGSFPVSDAAPLASAAWPGAPYSAGEYGEAVIDGHLVAAIGLDRRRGDVFPTLLAGHAPANSREIALGAQTLRELRRQVGETVTVRIAGAARTMRVVGEAVFPRFGAGPNTATDLGQGAVTVASLFGTPSPAGNGHGYNFLLLRLPPGANGERAGAAMLRIARAKGCPTTLCQVSSEQLPDDIANDARVRDTPLFLALTLALMGVATLAHVLVTSIRRRRRDLAVLKTLGFVRGQVSATVAFQSSALAVVAMLIGIPLGLAAGNWTWALFAGSVGVASDSALALPAVVLAIPATLIVANLVAAGPGWVAGRVRPAAVLRSE